MGDLVSEGAKFKCNFCTSDLTLSVINSSTTGDSKKLANQTNCMLPPPGGNCTFPPGAPPVPCTGVPPGCVTSTGQSVVKIDGQTALGEGCQFLCPKGQPVSLSSAGQTVAKHDEASVSAQIASLVADFIPFVGSGKSFYELVAGADPITGEAVGRMSSAAGIVLGVVPGGKAVVKGKKAAKVAKKALKQGASKKTLKAANDNSKKGLKEAGKKSHMERKVERYKKDINNHKKHISKSDLDAARRELNGEVVKLKDSGKPFDHVKEVRDSQKGLKNNILTIKKDLSESTLSAAEKQQLENLLSESSKLLDHTKMFVPK